MTGIRAFQRVGALALAIWCLVASCVLAQSTNTTAAPTPTPAPRVELTWEGIFVLVTVVIMILCMALNLIGSLPALFFVSTLFATVGIISVPQLFLGFVNKGMITIALMFVIVHPIAHLPRANWFVEKVIGPCDCGNSGADDENKNNAEGNTAITSDDPAEKEPYVAPWKRAFLPRLKLLLFAFVVSPFVENVPHVSVMSPVVTKVCRKLNIPTSQMLLPMAYCVCTANFLIISSASNLIIEALMAEYGVEPIGFFELVPSNGPVSLVLILYYLFVTPLLLPRRTTDTVEEDPDDAETTEGNETTTAGDAANPSEAGGSRQASPATVSPGTSDQPNVSFGLLPILASPAQQQQPPQSQQPSAAAAGPLAGSSPSKPQRRRGRDIHVTRTDLEGAHDFTVHFRVPRDGEVAAVGTPARHLLESFPLAARNKIRFLFLLRRRRTPPTPAAASSHEPIAPAEMTPAAGFDPDDYDVFIVDYEGAIAATHGGAEHDTADADDAVIIERDDILVFGGDASQLRTFRHLSRLHWVVADVPDRELLEPMPTSTRNLELPDHANANGPIVVDVEAYAHGRLKERKAGRIEFRSDWPQGLVTIGAEQQQKMAPFALVVVSNENPAVETRVSDNVFTRAYQSSIVSVRTSRGEHLWGRDLAMHILRAGDTLFLRTSMDFLKAQTVLSRDFYLVDPIDIELDNVLTAHYVRVPACFKRLASTRVTLRGDTAYLRLPDWYQNLTLLVFLAIVVAAMFGQSLPLACAIGICALVILNLITVQQAVRYVDWNVYATGSFAFGIGFGMSESGLAGWTGQLLTDAGVEGYALILLLYTLTALIGSIVSNRGAIQVMFPIAFAIFSQQGGNGMKAAAAAIANGAMGGFITPYGLTPCLIVAGPGQYLPKHFLFYGGPLFILYAVLGSLMISVTYGIW